MASMAVELRQQRAQVLEQARAMLDRAEAEHRDLTAQERSEWDQLMRKADELKLRIELEERGVSPAPFGPVAGGRDLLSEPERPIPDGGWAGSEDEWRALGPGESVREFLARRGALGDDPGITVGAFLRALAVGPRNDLERRTLQESIEASGGVLVPPALAAQLIDRLRAQSILNRLGARVLPLTSDQTSIAKLLSDPVPSWRGEAAAVAVGEPSFGAVTLKPKTLAVLVRVSRELLEDAPNLESILTQSITAAMAAELDRAALFGAGGNEPLGLTKQGIQTLDATGKTLDYQLLLDARQMLLVANAAEPTAWLMHPNVERKLLGLVDSTGQPLARPSPLQNARFIASTAIADGTIIAGNFAELVQGIRTDLRLELLRERFADTLEVAMLAYLRVDFAVQHAESFVQIANIA
ncbi:MAG: phage major capsid protein [Chloroflexi bacterium]|nr:phage major capsid protein [Chloroflexota bacterium]